MTALLLILVEYLELISFLLKPFDGARQGGLQFVDALQGIVEGYYRTVPRVAFHVLKHVVSVQMA